MSILRPVLRPALFVFAVLLMAASVAAQTGRRYVLRDTFTRMRSEKCYDLTREEGERAYRARDWETAANLFRAAKNCADADQRKRSLMSRRIGDSRQAAIQELVEKEREATRTARHALATNRANDALLLLKDGHRSLAFRLADFADQYIAPPDDAPNVQSRQAMLDAWTYLPYYHSWMRNYPDMRVTFCFQVAENLPLTTQIHYHQWQSGGRLYAFSPKEHLLRSWSDDLTETTDPIRMDTIYLGFEAAPDGRTLLFYSPKRLLLWRSPTQNYPIEITDKYPHWAFNVEGTVFHYLQDGHLQSLPLGKAFGTRGTKYTNRNTQKNYNTGDLPTTTSGGADGGNIDPVGLLGFSVKDRRLYLAYTDQIVVTSEEEGTVTTLRMPYALPEDTRPDQVRLWLNERLLTYSNDTLFVRFQLPAADSGAIVQEVAYAEYPIAHNPRLLVTRERQQDPARSRAFFREDPTTISHFVRHDLEEGKKGVWYTGDVSYDGSRVAVLTGDGALRVFELEKTTTGTTLPYYTSQGQPLLFSANAQSFAVRETKALSLFSADAPQEPTATFPLTDPSGRLLAFGNTSAIVQASQDSVFLWKYQPDKRKMLPLSGAMETFSLSTDERLLAYAENSTIQVMDVERGILVATYPETNLDVYNLAFVPNTPRLMLVARPYDADPSYGVDIKFWNVARPQEEPQLLLVSDLQNVTPLIALSPNSRWVSLMDGKSIRLFDLNNLSEEYTSLPGHKLDEANCTALLFSPDSRQLLMGYSDGHTVAWDISTRRQAYRLSPAITQVAEVAQLVFTPEGAALRQVLIPSRKASEQGTLRYSNTYTDRLLDVEAMRQYLSHDERQLMSFSPELIQRYDLESALSYEGNFERLAQSGDLPLIRSFFDFYQQQALQSNNSAQVRQYCERAFQLYQKLDEDNREALRSAMLSMYDNLIWKLIQRNKPEEAAQTVQHVGKNFNQPLSLTRWSGHIALLRGDAYLQAAATHYANWLMRSIEESHIVDRYNSSWEKLTAFTDLHDLLAQDLNRLHTYRLLRRPQQDMVCALLGEYITFSFCAPPGETPLPAPALEPTVRQQWQVFQMLNNAAKPDDYQEALDAARRLARQHPASRPLLERAALMQAQQLQRDGDFESGSDLALQYYAQAIRLVQDLAPFKSYMPNYWDLLSSLQVLVADIQLARFQLAKANQGYRDAATSMQGFVRSTEGSEEAGDWSATLSQRYAHLYTQRGFLALYENRPNDADSLFASANQILPADVYGVYAGHAALLRGDRTDALLNYGSLQNATELGSVWAELERMAEALPSRQAEFRTFAADLSRAVLRVMPDIDSTEARYWYATAQLTHFQAMHQWKDARHWSREMVRTVQMLLQKDTAEWEEDWFSAHLGAAYYHLFGGSADVQSLTEAIRLTEVAEQRLGAGGYYKDADLLHTNLAHAYLLRNAPGDRQKALDTYRAFLQQSDYTVDRWRLLQKDFRDLEAGGVKWPADMAQVLLQIKPEQKER